MAGKRRRKQREKRSPTQKTGKRLDTPAPRVITPKNVYNRKKKHKGEV